MKLKMKLMELYYRLWGEALNACKKNKDPFFSDYYKFWIFIQMSMLNSFWVMSLNCILYLFDLDVDLVEFFFPDLNNDFIEGIILFVMLVSPFAFIHYLLIFRNGKYKKLMEIYNTGKKKETGILVLGTFIILYISFIIRMNGDAIKNYLGL